MILSFIRFICLANIIISLVVAGITLNANWKARINILIAASLVLSSLWALCLILLPLTLNDYISRLSFIFGILIVPTMIVFIMVLTGWNMPTKRMLKIFAIPAILAALDTIPGLLYHNMILGSGGYIYTTAPGHMMAIHQSILSAYFLALIVIIILSYKRVQGLKRLQLTFAAVGLIGFLLLPDICTVMAPLIFGYYKLNFLSPLSIIFASVSLIYIATKHHIYEKRVILSEVWAMVLVILVLAWSWANKGAFNIVVTIAVIGIGYLLVKSVLSESAINHLLKKQNVQLSKAKKELESLDKMKDEFMMLTAHELNTPITIIHNLQAQYLDDYGSHMNEKQTKYLEEIGSASERLIHLSRNINSATSIQGGKVWLNKSDVDLEDLLTLSVEEMMGEANKKGIYLKLLKSNKELPHIRGDRKKLYEVFRHLLENAIKFTSIGGVEIKLGTEKDWLAVSISDTGVGIAQEDQKKLFTNFFQSGRFSDDTPLEQQGVGLGLYISKNIIEMHGGKIILESTVGKGSRFEVRLPV